MGGDKIKERRLEDLRRRAEDALASSFSKLNLPGRDPHLLMEEIRVYQVELEMQNEELRRTQEELSTALERYADLYDFAPVGYFSIDDKDRIVAVNLAGAALLGLERRLLINRSLFTFLAAGRSENYLAHRNRVRTSEIRQRSEVRLKKADGVEFWTEFQSVYVPAGPGQARGIRTAVIDIDERKRAEGEIRRSRKDWEGIFQAVGHPALILSPDYRVLEANRKALELAGLTLEAIREKRCFEVFHEFGRPPEGCPLSQMRRSGRPETVEMEVEKAGGTFLVSCTPLFDPAGRLEKAIHIAMDLTDFKALEARLQQSQKLESIGTLAGGVAHDFNNLLGIIMGYSEVIRDRVRLLDDGLVQDIDEVLDASRRARDLVKKLLGFARKQMSQPEALDLNRIVKDSLGMIKRLVGEDIELKFLAGADLWISHMDPSQIDQVLTNLAANSRDAIRDVGAITITTENKVLDESDSEGIMDGRPGEYVLLTFHDSGSGMDEKTKGRVFEPFFTTKEVGKGTGLGLATVYGIVRQNSGFIEVESNPAQGTTFRIYFPRYLGTEGTLEAFPREMLKGGKEVILLVEDEPELLNLTRKLLENQGYNVIAVLLPSEAIALCEKLEGPIHLLVTDVVMPTMNGKDLSDRIQRLRPGIKTLFMSGYPKNIITQRGVAADDVPFLEKPFSLRMLANKVREVLDR